MNNAEPIEAATVLLALLALLVSVTMLASACRTYYAAVTAGKCEAVLTLGWLRVRNEAFRVAISAGVCHAGLVNTWSPPPAVITSNRAVFQAIWLGIAFACLVQSVLNQRDNHRVVTIIERERAAGRMKPE